MHNRSVVWISICCFAVAVAASILTPAAAVENVRIDASSGVPRIIVDGKPVRARMFWGGRGPGQISLHEAGQVATFEFSPEDAPERVTMHINFGAAPGDIYLDDIRCVDLNTKQDVFPTLDFEHGLNDFQKSWTFWPPSGTPTTTGKVDIEPGRGSNGSAALHVTLKSRANSVGPDRPNYLIYHQPNLALRRGHRYRVSLWGAAKPPRDLTIAFYRQGATYEYLGGPPDPFHRQIKLAAAAGARFVSFPVTLPWPKSGVQADWFGVDGMCQRALDANPKALLVPRIVGMEPPAWWYGLHPGDRMVWDRKTVSRPNIPDMVVASPAYRHDAAERLAALVAHLEEKFGDRIAGYHPEAGEWFYLDAWGPALNGYAKADLTAWRAWLRTQYHNDAALRAAWRDSQVTLDTAIVPSPAARLASPAGTLRDPIAERAVIDFAVFQQEMMCDCICSLAHAVRQASHGRKLVFFFYGYVFEFGGVANGPATTGHYALRRVLDCPDIDVLGAPISYFDRALGQSAPAMTAAESVALAGKMWLHEDDTRTYLNADPSADMNGVDTIEKTNAELTRNTAQCALRNFGTWWTDLGATGWFDDPRMWAEMAKLKALDEPLLQTPTPFRPEVAAVIDEPTMMRVTSAGAFVTGPGVPVVRLALGRMGAPYGQYLQDDVAAGRVKAKMLVFLTAWSLSQAQRQQLLAASPGSLKIWCYAPGYQTENGTSLDAVRELTGFRVKKLSRVNAWAVPTKAGQKLGLKAAFGVDKPLEPLLAAADATPGETLATYPDGSAAVALRKTSHGWSMFVGPPGLTSELLRLAARRAGVHLITQVDCNVYANGPFVVLHGSQDRTLTIDVGSPGDVHDLLLDKIVGHGPKIALPLKKGETRVFRVEENN